MIKKRIQVAVLGCLLTTTAIADGWPFVASLSITPSWSSPGDTQTLFLQDDVFKTYQAQTISRSTTFFVNQDGRKTLVAGELFLGTYGAITHAVQGQFGLALASASDIKINGSIWEDADPNFNNYTYSYKVRPARLAAKAKFVIDTDFYDLFPYISGSAGVGFNKAASFEIVPRIYQEVPAPGFTSNKRTSFSFTAGAGIEMPVSECLRIGIGYELTDWGESELGAAPGQTLGKGIHLNHLYSQGLQLGLIYQG